MLRFRVSVSSPVSSLKFEGSAGLTVVDDVVLVGVGEVVIMVLVVVEVKLAEFTHSGAFCAQHFSLKSYHSFKHHLFSLYLHSFLDASELVTVLGKDLSRKSLLCWLAS